MYLIKTINMYGNIHNIIFKKNEDGTITSFGEYSGNSDYEDYLAWVAEGNQPVPADS